MAMNRRPPPRDTRAPQVRVNHRIRVPEVRVVLDDGTMLGVMTTQEALRAASERGLDLVEVNPKSVPPVCKILDFGKYKYEEKKKAAEAKRKQTVIELKEIKLRPKTDDHDLETKLRAARRFVESGNKVKFTVRFRGREITHPERAQLPLDWLVKNTEDLCNVEQRPTMEGRAMSLIIVPKPQVMQRLASQRAQKVHDDTRKPDDHDALSDDDDDGDDDRDDEESASAV
jgi:translation initiation factor IF-3